MTDNELTTTGNQNTKILALGTIIGALVGLGAAYLLLQRVEDEGGLDISPKEGVKLGISVFSFLRQITQLGD
jgi:glucokinase